MHSQTNRKGPKLVITDDAVRPVFKKCRNLKGSQREVGLTIGVSEASVRSTENALMTPSLLVAVKYCLYLETTLEELFPDLFVQARGELKLVNV